MQRIEVRRRPGAPTQGILRLGDLRLRAALGRSGISYRKREGDGATPAGVLPIVRGLYRADHVRRPPTPLPFRPIRGRDGWCDAPGDPNYNRPVRLPFSASHEKMWRDDALYDIVLVLDWNLSRRARGRGSAIFLHQARPSLKPTEGCIALSPPDLRRLLARLGRSVSIRVA